MRCTAAQEQVIQRAMLQPATARNRSDNSSNDNDFMSQKKKKPPWRRRGLTYSEIGKSLEFKDPFGSLPQQRKLPVRKAVRCGIVSR